MVIFLASGPGTASQTLVNRLLKSNIFFNKRRAYNFKKRSGDGNFYVKYSILRYLYFKLINLFKINILCYQHLLPTKNNFRKLYYLFGKNIYFIITTRNIFDIAKHFKKLSLSNRKFPLTSLNKKKNNFLFQTKLVILFYHEWSKYIKKYPNRVKLISFGDIISNNNPVKDIKKIMKKKIILNPKINANKHKKMNIILTKTEKKIILYEIKKIGEHHFKLMKIL